RRHVYLSSALLPPPPTSTLFPYTTLFRSRLRREWPESFRCSTPRPSAYYAAYPTRAVNLGCSRSVLLAVVPLPFGRAGEADEIVADSGPRSITPLLAGDSAIVIVVAFPLRGAATPGAAARTLS